MIKRRWMILNLAFLLTLLVSMPVFGWDKIISFGDSLSDNGPADGYGIAVASNGPVWLDYLADAMRDVELEDRALCGAQTTGPGTIGMDQQISEYVDSLSEDDDLSKTLFTIWIGGNDFLNMGETDPAIVIGAAIFNISSSIQELVAAGAEDILVMNLPDIGLAPIYNSDPYMSAMATELSATFNSYLTQLVCDLNSAYKNVRFYMADTFELIQYAVANGEVLGFDNVIGTCEDDGALPLCEGYIFYDWIHPTTATHKYLAALALGQVKHGRVDKEMKALLKMLKPLHPRKPFVVQCRH
jgi:hypothetical protein